MAEAIYYAVVWIDADYRPVRYNGKNLAKAAESLIPGTCYGSGPTAQEAVRQAEWQRAAILAARKGR
jgi:hypothetical protein